MSKVTIPLASVDMINNKLQQARTITLLIQGNNSTDAPLNDKHIDYALSAINDLLEDSFKALNERGDHV